MAKTNIFYPAAEVMIFTELGQLVLRSYLKASEQGDFSTVTDLTPVKNSSEVKKKEKVDTTENTGKGVISTIGEAAKKTVEKVNTGVSQAIKDAERKFLSPIDKDIISITTKRDLGNDCPTFSIDLVYRTNWFCMICPNDLVIIKLCRPPEKLKTVMVGLVDDCRRSIDYSRKTPQRMITVTGRGLNKAFLNFQLGIVNEVEITEDYLGYLGKEVTIEGCPANEAIDKIINTYAGNYINYMFADDTTLLNRVHLSLTSNPNYKIMDVSGLLNYQGSLWQLLKEIQNAPFNELFWEMDDKEFPTLYLRPTPFNKDVWNKLPYTEIADEEYISDSIGRSDLETYTLYSVNCMTMISEDNATNSFGYVPLWHPPFFPKYGIRRLDAVSLYTMYAGSEDAEQTEAVCLSATQDLFNWNIKNNSMFSGNITVRGSNRYKIGTRVMLLCDGIEFYVEGVTHVFNLFNTYQTQLQVTRGLPPKQRFTKPWGATETFDPGIYQLGHSKKGKSSGGSSGSYGGEMVTGDVKKVIDAARSCIGTRYCLGGNTPGQVLDCSGLVCYAYKKAGVVDLTTSNRSTTAMVNLGQSVDKNDKSKWKPGDLILCNPDGAGQPKHVQLYIGNGKMIHASSYYGHVMEDNAPDEGSSYITDIRRIIK